jgi:hypothetical protein
MAKCLFFTKRARPDITTAVAFLTSQRTWQRQLEKTGANDSLPTWIHRLTTDPTRRLRPYSQMVGWRIPCNPSQHARTFWRLHAVACLLEKVC